MIKNITKSKNNMFIKKPSEILLLLIQEQKWTVSLLSRRMNLSFLATMRILKNLEQEGYIITKKEKKFRYVSLTEKGTRVAEKIKELISVINEGKTNEINAKQ